MFCLLWFWEFRVFNDDKTIEWLRHVGCKKFKSLKILMTKKTLFGFTSQSFDGLIEVVEKIQRIDSVWWNVFKTIWRISKQHKAFLKILHWAQKYEAKFPAS